MNAISNGAAAPRWAAAVAAVAALAIVGAYAAPWLHYLCKPAATLLIAAMVWRLGAAAEPGYRRAIVAGLPSGVREKNLDADLLAPYSLYARHVGRPVTIRRTIKGRSVEERAIIRSGGMRKK